MKDVVARLEIFSCVSLNGMAEKGLEEFSADAAPIAEMHDDSPAGDPSSATIAMLKAENAALKTENEALKNDN